MLTDLRQVQIPLLAALLIGACLAKAWRACRARRGQGPGSLAAVGPAGLFPARRRGPLMALTLGAELVLGAGLIGTAGWPDRAAPAWPATVVRAGTALFFLVAAGVLNEARQRRPDAGCGCFGELSETPIGLRAIARAGLLAAAAAATIGLRPLTGPAASASGVVWLAAAAAELAALAALSPELGEIMVRLGYSEPCELRRVPVGRTLAALHASSSWRRYASQISAPAQAPADMWREGCWRFVLYPGFVGGRRVDVIFAVYLSARRPPVRAAVLDAVTDEVLAPGGLREAA